jgi:hypothetical protein
MKRSRLSGLSKDAQLKISRLPVGIKFYTFFKDGAELGSEVVIKAFSLGDAYKKLLAQEGLRKEDVILDEVATYTGGLTSSELRLARKVE